MLDTNTAIETPEGIELQLIPAGPVPRVLAYCIDLLIRTAVLAPIAIGLGFAGNFGTGIILIISFLLEWFYPVFFEMFNHGTTPGKKAMGLWVVQDDGTPIQWESSMLRNILRAADFFPMFYMGGMISMAATKQFKRLGDLAAGTLVVYRQELPKENNAPGANEGMSRTAPLPLTLTEQQAMIAFQDRAEMLTPERRSELAQVLQPLLKKSEQEMVEEIEKIARGLRR